MSDFWSAPAISGIGYPLLVAAILAVASRLPKVGPPLRGWFVHVAKWLWNSRPVMRRSANRQALAVAQADQELIAKQDATVKQQAEQLEFARTFITQQTSEHQAEVGRLRQGKEDAEEHLRLFVTEAEGMKRKSTELQGQVRDLLSRLESANKRTRELMEGHKEAQKAQSDKHQADLTDYANKAKRWEEESQRLGAEVTRLQKELDSRSADGWTIVESPPEPPRPQPRWGLLFPDDPNEPLGLANFVPRSVTRRVRVDSDRAHLRILDAAYWDEVLGGTEPVTFACQLTAMGRANGATVYVQWYDENDEIRRDELEIEAPNPPPPVSWSVNTPF